MDFKEKIIAIRGLIANLGIDYFVLPRADQFQGEYVSPDNERLKWLTGFSGSAGVCVVSSDHCVLFIDGRYTIQARHQVDTSLFQIEHLNSTPPHEWLSRQLKIGDTVGIDPWHFTPKQAEVLNKVCNESKAELKCFEKNPVDQCWVDRPFPPNTKIFEHTLDYCGESMTEKVMRLRKYMKERNIHATFITDPDSLCWIFNIRANDLKYTPTVFAYAVVDSDRIYLFTDKNRLKKNLLPKIKDTVNFYSERYLFSVLKNYNNKNISIDSSSIPQILFEFIEKSGGQVDDNNYPIPIWKACKNQVELNGIRNCHIRDGSAVCEFLHWFETEEVSNHFDEYQLAKKVEQFRENLDSYVGPSYYPISAVGPNSAICHYEPPKKKSRLAQHGDIFLIDSGGQFLDGTTDFTRVVSVGCQPTLNQMTHYTLVLKSHIALASTVFPFGTSGMALDSIARRPLWATGLDYDHGTGHGVGCFLSVHEGPQKISKTSSPIPLDEGMILSIEPGYYLEDEYGIRFENLVEVKFHSEVDGVKYLEFSPLTMVPVEKSMVRFDLLTKQEKRWLKNYQDLVIRKVGPFLDRKIFNWLKEKKI